MTVGIAGSGSMAAALTRGWGEPVLLTDAGSGRAAALAAEVGGEALGSNAELAERADVVILCHKPAQLEAVAAELAPHARAVVSVLAMVPLVRLRAAYPGANVLRLMPNIAAELRRGVTAHAADPQDDPELLASIRERFERLGAWVDVPESLMDLAMALISTPAHFSLVAEALVEGAVRHGMPAGQAAPLVTAAMDGTAALLSAGGHDTHALRRAITSPGGSTIRGIEVLEEAGVRGAMMAAVGAAIGGAAR
jgi:pyrroline-5-carboxylate reductase